MSSQSWWSRQRREFALANEQRRLRAAVRRQKRRVRAEESRRARAERSRHSSWSRAYQRFLIWRRVRAEKRKSSYARWRDKYAWFRWIERKQGLVVGSVFLLLVAVFCAFLFRETYSPKRQRSSGYGNEPAVTVNGKVITMERYIKSLEVAHGPMVLQVLTEQEAVRQEAERLKVALTAEERAKLQDSVKKDPQFAVKYPELESRLLIQKIVLKVTPEERKKEVYETFKEDFRVYSLAGLRFSDLSKAEKFLSVATSGGNVKEAAKSLSSDKDFSSIGVFTLGQIREAFGVEMAEAVASLKVGKFTVPFVSGSGFAVYTLTKSQNSYEAAKPFVESLIIEAETAKLMHRILSAAEIDSPYLERNLLKSGSAVEKKEK